MTYNSLGLYKNKHISIDAALELIHSGDEIVTSFCALEPLAILSKLHTIKDRVDQKLMK